MTSATSYQFVLIVVLRADKRYDINFGHKSRRPSLGKKSSGFFAPTTTAAGTTKLSNAGAKFQITASRAIWMVIGLAKACTTMTELRDRVAALDGKHPMQLRFYLPNPVAS